MAKEIDSSAFEASELLTSASPVQDTLPDALHSTVHESASECIEVQGYSIEKIMTICNIARRTAFKYASEVLQVWYWKPETDFRVSGFYSELALSEIKRRKGLGTLDAYRGAIHSENEAAIAAYQSRQQPEAAIPQAGQLATTEVVGEDPTISEITRIRENRYYVPDSGSNRLARAQETRQTQRFNLNDTRQRVQQAFLGLAVQTHENQQATEIEREADKEQLFEKTYANELERIQVENAAREAARADYAAFQEQVRMGNAHVPTTSSIST